MLSLCLILIYSRKVRNMENKKTSEPAAQAAEKKEEPNAIELLQEIGKLGYPFADSVGKIAEIDRKPDEYKSYGFKDANGRKIIVLTFPKDLLKLWLEDAVEK
jgi:hypothetical protein